MRRQNELYDGEQDVYRIYYPSVSWEEVARLELSTTMASIEGHGTQGRLSHGMKARNRLAIFDVGLLIFTNRWR